MGGEQKSGYAQLPDELIEAIIHDVPSTIKRASHFTGLDTVSLDKARNELSELGLIVSTLSGDTTDSMVAVDGGYAMERLADFDLALVQSAGVEGLSDSDPEDWGQKNHQYMAWQYALSHNIANETLVKGIMSLMEMTVLSGSDHEIKLLDGSHISQVIAIDQLFSANKESADQSFVDALGDFLNSHYGGDIYKIPSTISNVINNDTIVASTKYSSSRSAIDSFLNHLSISVNDKALFGRILESGEYLKPQPIIPTNQDSTSWSSASIKYDIPLGGVDHDKFNWLMNEAIGPMRTRGIHNQEKQSNLYYTYFRPCDEGPAYRIEVKQSLALDEARFQRVLRSIQRQVIYPDIIEPYPQYLADIIAKSVSKGLQAVREAVVLSNDTAKDATESLMILRGYRT